jgi:hypothetical protein
MMMLGMLMAAVSLLPEGGVQLKIEPWEDPKPFVETIIRPELRDFTPYDRCILDYAYLGESGESIHMYFAGESEIFGKTDVLAERKTVHSGPGRWTFSLSRWPKCTDPKNITRIRIRTDRSRGGELWLRKMTLLRPGETPAPAPLTPEERSRCEKFEAERGELREREFRRRSFLNFRWGRWKQGGNIRLFRNRE